MKQFLFLILLSVFFISCSSSLSEKEIETYMLQGKEIAEATQRTLGANLIQKMRKGGPKDAVPYCNTMAYPLTEKMALKYDASIKRTSDKSFTL